MANENLTEERINWLIDYFSSDAVSLYAGIDVVQVLREVQKDRKAASEVVAFYQHDGSVITIGSFGYDAEPGKPIPLYSTSKPAQVVPPAKYIAPENDSWVERYSMGWNACRAAMLQLSGNSEPVSKPYTLPEEKGSSLQLRNLIRQRHAEWSDKTFGNVGPVGPLKHLAKEALEAAAEPGELSEWADMQFLLWDAQRRAGICDGEVTAAMEEKLNVNMARQWPEPKDGEPRLHIKEPTPTPTPTQQGER